MNILFFFCWHFLLKLYVWAEVVFVILTLESIWLDETILMTQQDELSIFYNQEYAF